jgi:hypothetical protein
MEVSHRSNLSTQCADPLGARHALDISAHCENPIFRCYLVHYKCDLYKCQDHPIDHDRKFNSIVAGTASQPEHSWSDFYHAKTAMPVQESCAKLPSIQFRRGCATDTNMWTSIQDEAGGYKLISDVQMSTCRRHRFTKLSFVTATMAPILNASTNASSTRITQPLHAYLNAKWSWM